MTVVTREMLAFEQGKVLSLQTISTAVVRAFPQSIPIIMKLQAESRQLDLFTSLPNFDPNEVEQQYAQSVKAGWDAAIAELLAECVD